MKLHSYMSRKCEIKRINRRKGIFATESIEKGELVIVWGGAIYTASEVKEISEKYPHFLTHPVSVYEGYYLGSTSKNRMDDVEYCNHSCDPNVGVKGQILLVARKKILIGEEICFDYETTEIVGEEFECNCGAENCRKKITGNAWMDSDFQKKNAGYFSWYIDEKIQKRKHH